MSSETSRVTLFSYYFPTTSPWEPGQSGYVLSTLGQLPLGSGWFAEEIKISYKVDPWCSYNINYCL